MKLLFQFKRFLVFGNILFIAALMALLIRTFIADGGDIPLLFMSTAITLSTLVTLTLSYEILHNTKQNDLELKKDRLHLLHNYFKSASLLSHTIKVHIESQPQTDLEDIRLLSFVQTLNTLYNDLLTKEQLGMISSEIVHIIENSVRLREISKQISKMEFLNILDNFIRTNQQIDKKIIAMQAAESIASFENISHKPNKENK